MTSVVFYFQAHQPYRLRHLGLFDIGAGQDCFDDDENLVDSQANEADLVCEYEALCTPRLSGRLRFVRVGPRRVLER